jgi:hypothetical protein
MVMDDLWNYIEMESLNRGYMTQRHELKDMHLKIERPSRKPRVLLQHKELALLSISYIIITTEKLCFSKYYVHTNNQIQAPNSPS